MQVIDDRIWTADPDVGGTEGVPYLGAVQSSTGMASIAKAWMLCAQICSPTGEGSCSGLSTSLEGCQAWLEST